MLNIVEVYDAETKFETQEALLTNVVRKELGDLAEFMFLLQQPEAYTKWKDKQAEEAEEAEAAEAGDYEYVDLDEEEMTPETFDELVGRLNQLPPDYSDDGAQPDLLPMPIDGEDYGGFNPR